MKIAARAVLLVFFILVISGCVHKIADKKLEDVAKDWCETIRASQLISVYPLTEDLQPGDIFLVQLPVDFQQEAYKRKGFLPLDNLIHRMHPARYKEFYSKSFGVGGDQKPVPGYWLAPGANANWSQAPNAKFPTYSFSARSGGGFSLALPVHGVPIGLSLMGGDAAEGTITIAEAYTYGVDAKSLYDQVKKWAEEDKSVKEFLKNLGRTEPNQNYLRVVTRVYLTGKLNISLQSSGQMAGGVTVGAAPPLNLVVPGVQDKEKQEATLEAYKKSIDALNDLIKAALGKVGGTGLVPGASLRVAAASAGSISMIEDLGRPLVIGYLGFDVPILRGGGLGPPFPTYAILEENQKPPTVPAGSAAELFSLEVLTATYHTLRILRSNGDQKAANLMVQLDKAAAEIVPANYPCNIRSLRDINGPLIVRKKKDSKIEGEHDFGLIAEYRAILGSSVRAIRYAKDNPSIRIEPPDSRDSLEVDLKANQDALKVISTRLKEDHSQVIREATNYVASLEVEEE